MRLKKMCKEIGWLALIMILLITPTNAEGSADLSQLVNSYEDQKMSAEDLAIFLTAHGYHAVPHEDYVVASASGKELYIVPNGASKGLADIFQVPPSETGEELVGVADHIDIGMGATYAKTNNREFVNAVRNAALFPIAPSNEFLEGSKRMGRIYTDLGYTVVYMYNPDYAKGQGYKWILVKDEAAENTWQAVDSYYGPVDGSDYYYAPYSSSKPDDLN